MTWSPLLRRRALAVALAGALLLSGSAFASTAADAAPARAGGRVAMPKDDLPRWQRVIAEDFSRPAALGRFAATYPGWAGYDGDRDTSRGLGRPRAQQGLWNSATTVSVHDGRLDCRLHTRGATPQLCAITPTATGRWWQGRKYGKYVVRFHTERTPGYTIAWLLWPQSDDWDEGEIDFPEASLTGTITGAAHALRHPEDTPAFIDTGVTAAGWHTASITWRPGRLTFRLDGRSWSTTRASVLPTTSMRWALQAESQLSATPPKRSTSGRILIDWVAAYRWRG